MLKRPSRYDTNGVESAIEMATVFVADATEGEADESIPGNDAGVGAGAGVLSFLVSTFLSIVVEVSSTH